MSEINLRASPEQLGLLDDLADELAAKTAQIPAAAQRVFLRSFPHILEKTNRQLLPAYWQAGKVNLHWQLFLTSRNNQVFFLFFKRKNTFDNSLATDIRMTFSPCRQLAALATTASLGYFWSPPSFLELNPSPDLIKLPATQSFEDLLWVRIGPNGKDLLAVDLTTFSKGNPMYYFAEGEKKPKTAKAKKAPLEWFEALLDAIRPWANGKTAAPIPIDLAASEGTIKRILQILSENFLTMSHQMQMAQSVVRRHPIETYHPYYQLSKYEVSVRFRLNDEGRVIGEEEGRVMVEGQLQEEDLFQLEVLLRGHWSDGQPNIHFKILPPDFLTGGPLHLAFLEKLNAAITGDEGTKRLEKIVEKLEIPDAKTFLDALNKRPNKTFIFRIKRGRNWDKNVFVMPVSDSEGERYLWFNIKCRVDVQHNAVAYKLDSLENLLKKGEPRKECVRYFMRLLFQINEWKKKVV
ncbi:MAG: hypothetical protein AAFZ15_02395 [Bacteroidota bacterium]